MTDQNTIKEHILSLNLIPAQSLSAVILDNGSVGIVIDLGMAPQLENVDQIREQIETSVMGLDDITHVSVILTKERDNKKAGNSGNSVNSEKSGGIKKAPDFNKPKPKPAPTPKKGGLKGVKHVIAVSSGKGGVGKSTTAVNLAIALQKLGHSVGLLDADIYGPSLTKLLNVKTGRPPIVDGVIQPVMAGGMKTMSIGYMVGDDQPIVWRGPKVMGAISQLFNDVDWTGTDILVLDLPPGTGDVQLSIAQQVKLSGAIIVSTPQDLALLDARKGLKMFQMVNIPILGILENMSHFVCPSCGHTSHIFGCEGTQTTANELNVPLIGKIPLHMSLRSDLNSDQTAPAFMLGNENDLAEDEKAIYQAFMTIAEKLETELV